jgi:Na+-transporting methylmalonyl-CoA/oxaloacetate decarboxylase gamma subunit
MKDWVFGLTMTIAGMGVTFLTLYILTLVIQLLDRLFPYKEGKKKEEGK